RCGIKEMVNQQTGGLRRDALLPKLRVHVPPQFQASEQFGGIFARKRIPVAHGPETLVGVSTHDEIRMLLWAMRLLGNEGFHQRPRRGPDVIILAEILRVAEPISHPLGIFYSPGL